jgi:hypothetical protein
MKQQVVLFLLIATLFSCKKEKFEDVSLKVKSCFGTATDIQNDGAVQFTTVESITSTIICFMKVNNLIYFSMKRAGVSAAGI